MQYAAVDLDLAALDSAVEAAIVAGRADGLRVLGYGEITLVLGWPADAPVFAVKRLPVFPDRERLDAYADLLVRYTAELRAAGVGVVATELRHVPGPRGSEHAYIVQPYVPADRHLETHLRGSDRDHAARLLAELVDAVVRCVDKRVGLDAQAANWAVGDGGLECFDVSTPMLRAQDGREELDLSTFLSIYPPLMRPLLARIAPGVMAQYHDVRTVLLDVASNLHKDGLHDVLPVFLEVVGERIAEPIAETDVMRYFRQDKLLWAGLQRLRLADRSWQRIVRRRPYPFLLPARYRYGPPRRHERQTR